MESDNDDDAGYDDYVCSEHDNGDHMKRRKRNEFQSVSPLNVSRTKPISSTFLPSSHIILLIVTMLKLFMMFFIIIITIVMLTFLGIMITIMVVMVIRGRVGFRPTTFLSSPVISMIRMVKKIVILIMIMMILTIVIIIMKLVNKSK